LCLNLPENIDKPFQDKINVISGFEIYSQGLGFFDSHVNVEFVKDEIRAVSKECKNRGAFPLLLADFNKASRFEQDLPRILGESSSLNFNCE